MILPRSTTRKILFLFLLLSNFVSATNPNLKNIGFENGFTGWIGKTWIYYTSNGGVKTTPTIVTLPYDPSIVLMSDQTAYDLYTNSQLKTIPSGYKYSARLGSYKNGSPNGRDQSLEYTLNVNPSNELLTIKFAVVLEMPKPTQSTHTEEQMPRFIISILDKNGNEIPNFCNKFDENTLTLDNMQQVTLPTTQQIVRWRDWKAISANLKEKEGQDVTIKFTTMDCTPGGHFGYAYIVVDSQPLYITTKFCGNNEDATLTAPDGFKSYTWKHNGSIIGSNYECKVPNAKEGEIYSCIFTTEAGCNDSLSTTIKRIQPIADFKFTTTGCTNQTNTVKFTNNSIADALHPSDASASLSYQWNFGDGKTSAAADTTYTFSTSGMQKVNLKVTSYPSTCTASKDTMIEVFYPPLIGIKGDTTYCPNQVTNLKGYGADHYKWIQIDGSQTGLQDSLLVGSPGGKVGLIGYSKNDACYTTKYLNISEEPIWNLDVCGDPFFCTGDSTTLVASGEGISYLWNSQNLHSPAITISKQGTYEVVATNKRGCQLSWSDNVKEIPLPSTSFSVDPTVINTKHNQVVCSITPENDDMTYEWDMGDKTTEKGVLFTHYYSGNSGIGKYDIMLTAINNVYGCRSKASQSIIMEPFIPNVFTPNGDSMNDYFMPNYDLEVFDRQGILVYKGNKDSEGWDGKYKGIKADPDTYFYILHYIDYTNTQRTAKGFVMLVR
ncbi:gliding motility-associated C-terminal domain-containing protein [Paludibacter jiangxiensis]|uniref:Gliding motility-associated C-terminal domain-containing protein n=1 Tax=Paludibacter jiangxiensis TaxID=681398 RepID=A0A161LHA9_9BACT|nr:gliding motility-associated C-terminal domain-containing protein [Paludibacter jiangxiensis]